MVEALWQYESMSDYKYLEALVAPLVKASGSYFKHGVIEPQRRHDSTDVDPYASSILERFIFLLAGGRLTT